MTYPPDQMFFWRFSCYYLDFRWKRSVPCVQVTVFEDGWKLKVQRRCTWLYSYCSEDGNWRNWK